MEANRANCLQRKLCKNVVTFVAQNVCDFRAALVRRMVSFARWIRTSLGDACRFPSSVLWTQRRASVCSVLCRQQRRASVHPPHPRGAKWSPINGGGWNGAAGRQRISVISGVFLQRTNPNETCVLVCENNGVFMANYLAVYFCFTYNKLNVF